MNYLDYALLYWRDYIGVYRNFHGKTLQTFAGKPPRCFEQSAEPTVRHRKTKRPTAARPSGAQPALNETAPNERRRVNYFF